jgi:acetyl-CoA carboxylase biotin carboxylase subunit
VPSNYDSLLAKVITHAPTRELALKRMRRALDEFIIGGIRTNIELHKRLLDLPEVREGRMTTRTVENRASRGFPLPLS